MNVKNKSIIFEIMNIEENTNIKSEDLLVDYGWDSLSAVMLLTYFSDKYDLEINPDDLESLKNFLDLDSFISSNAKN